MASAALGATSGGSFINQARACLKAKYGDDGIVGLTRAHADANSDRIGRENETPKTIAQQDYDDAESLRAQASDLGV